MKVIFIYYDRSSNDDLIIETIGKCYFGDVIKQKERIEEKYKKIVRSALPDVVWKRVKCETQDNILTKMGKYADEDIRVIFALSDYVVSDVDTFALSLQKVLYIEESYSGLIDGKPGIWFFKDINSFIKYYENKNDNEYDSFNMEGLYCINQYDSFVRYVTGNLDSRYFNSISGDEYTITKSSTNKSKIYAEYMFYKLLPEDMQHWFVQPFGYSEGEKSASYSMERMHMTDLSIKWVHGSIVEEDFNDLLDLYFRFFSSRHVKKCSPQEYNDCRDQLYVNKVQDRVKQLQNLNEYEKISELLTVAGINLNDLVKRYLALKNKYEANIKLDNILVIGHGDPCFSNTLYSKKAHMLRFIDPKGATKEEELWTNPYYDIAKLSHSICGCYDFINNKLYELKINEGFDILLDIPCDIQKYKDIFNSKLISEGMDYYLIRIYEVSLFLSMLPLHIESPIKVVSFIINAKNILDELERELL